MIIYNERLTPNLEWRREAVKKILQYGRKEMLVHVWKNESQLLRDVAMNPKEDPSILELFRPSGGDANRKGIFSLLAEDPQLSEVMHLIKSKIVMLNCWNVQEQLFGEVVKELSISSRDVVGGKGN
jgi:hypothetical protein